MQNEDDGKSNKLISGRGSIAERTKLAKELDDDRLQRAAPYSAEAKEELERRRHERLLTTARDSSDFAVSTSEDSKSFWEKYARPIIIGIIVTVIGGLIFAAIISYT